MKSVLLNGAVIASLCGAIEADAQFAMTQPQLAPVVVTATRIESPPTCRHRSPGSTATT
jgi:outer membrane cobalamin receptor